MYFCKILKGLCTVQDKPSGELVIVLEAEDSDTGPNGEVSYTLVQRQDNKDWQSFNLDADTGRLTTNRRLDREQQNEYQVEGSHASLNLECFIGAESMDSCHLFYVLVFL